MSRTPRTSEIGLGSLVALIIANMVGTGLYTSSGYALRDLHDAKWVLLVWALGGIMALSGAVAYGALARRLPFSGGEYLYLSRLVHPTAGFLAGFISLCAGFTAPIAAAAVVFARYAVPESTRFPWMEHATASSVIVAGTLFHAFHLRTGAWTQNLIVLLKLAFLVWFLVLAIVFGPSGGWTSGVYANEHALAPASWSMALAVMSSLVFVSLSYTGFNAAVYLAGEFSPGDLRVARSMWIATLLVTLLYLGLNAVFLYAIPPEEMAGSETFVAAAAQAIGGGSLEGMMRIAILLSSATSVFAMLMAGPRVYAQMARDGVLPRLLATDRTVPTRAILIQGLLSLVVVWLTQLEPLLSYLGLTLSVCGAFAISGLWWLKYRIPDAEPIRWYEHLSAAFFILMSLILLCVAAFVRKDQFVAFCITVVVGVLCGVLYEFWKGKQEVQNQ